jgi:hypothetical protein
MAGAFDADPLYKSYSIEIDPTCLIVDNGLEDTYELDEITNILATLNANLHNNTHFMERRQILGNISRPKQQTSYHYI